MLFFLKGLFLGFSIAAPVGPIGLLCLRYTLTSGRVTGLCAGLGAATADATYGLLAGLGLTFMADLLLGSQVWLQLIGGLFLCFLGFTTFHAPPATQAAVCQSRVWAKVYFTTFLLTLSNPLTILSFAGIFAGLGLGSNSANYGATLSLVSGVFTGSALWWLILSSSASLLHSKLSTTTFGQINRVAGGIIGVMGIFALLKLLMTRDGS